MKIVVTGPAIVTSAKTGEELSSPRRLRKLNKLVSDDACSNYLDGELSDLDLQGGQVKMAFDAKTGKCSVVTEYESAEELTAAQLEALKSETRGQWSDGIGEGCFDEFQSENDMQFDLCPASSDVTIEQFELKGKKGKVKRRMIFGAIKKGDISGVRKAIDSGEDLESRKEHMTPLLYAIYAGQVEVARVLLEAGADVHAHSDGTGVLMTCAVIRSEHLSDDVASDLAELLLSHGADPNAVSNMGNHPLELARMRGKTRLAGILEANGSILLDVLVNIEDAAGQPASVELIVRHEHADGAGSFKSNKKGEMTINDVTPANYRLTPLGDFSIEPASIIIKPNGEVEPPTLVVK